MNSKIKLFAAVCGLSLACLVSAQKSNANSSLSTSGYTAGCEDPKDSVCFVELDEDGNVVRRFPGYWVESGTHHFTNAGDCCGGDAY